MTGTRSWVVLSLVMLTMVGSCSAMAGDLQHYPATLPAIAIMIIGKLLNDRYKFVKWPMEFIFWSAMLLIFANLIFLHFKEF
jgi:uncharacterized protein (DUF983 family)